MASIPYIAKQISISLNEVDLAIKLLNESYNGYELCEVIKNEDKGTTDSNAIFIFKRNQELIFTEFSMDDNDDIPDRYMTAEQIRLIKDFGKMELNGVSYTVTDAIITYNYDKDDFLASITLESETRSNDLELDVITTD